MLEAERETGSKGTQERTFVSFSYDQHVGATIMLGSSATVWVTRNKHITVTTAACTLNPQVCKTLLSIPIHRLENYRFHNGFICPNPLRSRHYLIVSNNVITFPINRLNASNTRSLVLWSSICMRNSSGSLPGARKEVWNETVSSSQLKNYTTSG